MPESDTAAQLVGNARQWCEITANMTGPKGPAALLQKYGQEFKTRRTWDWHGTPQACYANAQFLAKRRWADLRYVEGFACSVIPVEHAWCIDGDGQVIDPTWDEKYPPDYFGIVFSQADVRALRKLTGKQSYSLLFTWWKWREMFPELQRRLDASARLQAGC